MRTLTIVLLISSLVGCDRVVKPAKTPTPVVGPFAELSESEIAAVSEAIGPEQAEELAEVFRAKASQQREELGKKLLPEMSKLDPAESMRGLKQIERSIQSEPKYDAKPKYCLLVLGPKQDKRVWLAMDGLTLYADKNCDGLLAASERFELTAKNEDPTEFEKFYVGEGDDRYEVEVGLWIWLATHDREIEPFQSISVRTSDGLRFMAWGDQQTALRFHPSIDEAPIVHVGGPLQMGFEVREPFKSKGDGSYEISAAVGTYGVGPGSFACLGYGVIPPSAQPKVKLTIPSAKDGLLETTLDHRC